MTGCVEVPMIVASRPSRWSGEDTTTSSVYVPLHTTTVAHFGDAFTAVWMLLYWAVAHDSPELVELPVVERKIASPLCPLALAVVMTSVYPSPAPASTPAASSTRAILV